MNKEIINILKEKLGDKVLTDQDILDMYSVDETSDLKAMPDLLIRAESVEDISITLQICNKNDIPVIPRGGGSGVTGGAIAVNGGVILSLERMNKILEIDTENMVAVVEPGVITGILQEAVKEHGLMYPPDPASLDICSIGGNVAENAGGPSAVKYGTTKDYILGLECVLADGSIIEHGGKLVKNATGYNLVGMLIGSEGTLAVITKLYLKLIPSPAYTTDLLIPFDSIEDALDNVHMILTNRITPSTIEFMEEDAIQLVAKHLDNKIAYASAKAHLLILIDGNSQDEVHELIVQMIEHTTIDPEKVVVAESPIHREKIWKARRSIRESIHAESPVFLAEDCVVPRSKIPEFLKSLKSYLQSQNLRSVMFGHAGDGNVHIDILKDDMDYETWKEMLPDLKKEIYKRALDCGGTITGEHGIGFIRKQFLDMAVSEAEIELYKRIKAAFDPKGIINPGKIIPD